LSVHCFCISPLRTHLTQARQRKKKGIVAGEEGTEVIKAASEKRSEIRIEKETTKILIAVIVMLVILGALGVYLNLTKKKKKQRFHFPGQN